MAEGPPVRIDRAALERIIRRATELQTSERELGDALTSDEVMALGREVGIPSRYLQQALLEEQTRIVSAGPGGVVDRLTGPPTITAQRVVNAEREAVESGLVRFLEQHELFCVQRYQPGRITWEPAGGIQAAIRRAYGAAGASKRPMMLARADTVSAAAVDLEPGFSHVTLTATARKARNEAIGGGAALATAGVVGTSVLVALDAMLLVALIPAPVALGLGYLALRRYGPVVARIHLGLERVLDHLEHGGAHPGRNLPPQPSLVDLLANEVRRALK